MIHRMAAFVLAVSGALPSISHAQTVELPAPVVTLSTRSGENQLDWPAVAPTVGRSVTGTTFFFTRVETLIVPNNFGGFDTLEVDVPAESPAGFDPPSPQVDLGGAYQAPCDLFLRITRVSLQGFDSPLSVPPRDVRGIVQYQLWLNTESIGSPAFVDSISFREPGTQPLDARLGLHLTVGSTIDQPTSLLGSIPVTVSGMNTGLAPVGNYLVAAEGVGGFGPGQTGTLTFRVIGPYQDINDLPIGELGRDSTMVATAANTPIKVMDGMYVAFGSGGTAPGDTVSWTARHMFPPSSKIEANLESFEGYHVWRSDLPNVNEFTLLGEILECDDTKAFVHQDIRFDPDEFDQLDIELIYDDATRMFTLLDRDVHDDFPYRYAVSTFDRGFLGNLENITFESELSETGKIYPARTERDAAQGVYTVPNPYKRSAAWEENQGKIVFANLPPTCTIRIFTVAADHVATIEHGPGQPLSTSNTSTSWDLLSSAGEDVVPGIYIYYVEGQDFQQTGKIIIVR